MEPETAEFPRDTADSTRLFREAGFSDPESTAAAWSAAANALPAGGGLLAKLDETWRLVRASPDPELAFATWLRWIEGGLRLDAGRAATRPAPELATREAIWEAHAEFRAGFIRLAGASPALGEILLTSWPDFRPWEWRSGWETRSSLARRIAAHVEPAADKDFPDAVRRLHRIELLRIAYLDCVEGLPVEQVTSQISAAADALIAACHARATTQVSRRLGKVPPPGGFVVLALGKLGGLELNYSSDVDLNFVYDDATGPLLPAAGGKAGEPGEAETFFTLIAERLVHLITTFTDQGRLFRLDTRLRPGGSSGRLVWSLRATVEYYYSTGRAWEKQALIRLRPVAGDFLLGERLRRELDAFVFPPTLSDADIAEIRGLKLQMEKIAEDRGPSEAQIKIGRGGIRDVEYIVQFLQLVHASRIPDLKAANTFQAFELLDAHGLLSPEETDVLRQGYRFLRKVEHHIQMAHLRQTHRLPDDPRELRRLARNLDFDTPEAFLERLAFHARRIRKVYRLLFEEATRAGADEIPALLELPAELALKAGGEALAFFGYQDPERAFLRLRSLAERSGDRNALDASRAKTIFGRLAEKLLREVSRHPEPDRTLANFEECVQALGARSVFYELLDENPRILQLFIEICARSSLVVETLRAHPDLFDELVDRLLTDSSFDREGLIADVDRLFEVRRDTEPPAADPAVELFKLKHLHLLLTAVRDLEDLDNLSTTLARIADVAEALLHGVLRRCLAEAESRMGAWPGEPPRFVVLGLSSWAARR
jgi:glutamate-ammonia-ligase adenylyltransferase